MTNSVAKEEILSALKQIDLPGAGRNIVEAGLLSEIVIHGGKVYFSITVPPEQAQSFEAIRQDAQTCVQELQGVESATITLTADHKTGQAPKPNMMPPASGPSMPSGKRPPQRMQSVPGVKHIIAVASGKGGVGKSTTSVNLALGLQALGLSVGILDADIYGPSMPRLLGITGKPNVNENDKLNPMQAFNVKVMSMGFLVNEDTPMIWRGPMVISALSQMLKDVDWNPIDILVVDMPPGTGDAQLTMAQQVPLAGAVIVSTPQDLALIDARKGLNMFVKVKVPVLGIVENMSYFVCPSCGARSDIFGHGGAEAEAKKLGTPFLGAVPLHMDIRETSDMGQPIVVHSPDSEHARIYTDIAASVWQQVQEHSAEQDARKPKIVIE
ncbi:MAG: Mrp/NBP35 family ATP-binding protein [Pseudomonadota bacterium]